MSNNAEKELRSFSGDADLHDWLIEHQFIGTSAVSHDIRLDQDWYRPGSESYIISFSINQRDTDGSESSNAFIGKACIKAPCTETMTEWVQRRKFLEGIGIHVPRLYAVSKASLIEERIEHTIEDAYTLGSPEAKADIARDLYNTYASLSSAGFMPRVMHDVRSRGNDAVIVDFGEDLGGIMRESGRSQEVYSAFGRHAVKATLGELSLTHLEF